VEIGLALGTVDARSGRPLPLADVAEQAAEAEQLGYSSAWVMDHLFVERDGVRGGAHDPFVTLGHLAGRTSRITLGVLVAAAPFRHPGQLAREAAAVADAAPGRFVLGLGSGWHEPEFTAFDLPFQRKVARLEEYLQLVKRLLAGERVSAAGGFYNMRDASLLITAPAPPVWLAAFGPRMLALTARHADGWNVAWLGADPERFMGLKGALDAARGNRPMTISVGVQVEPGQDVKRMLAAYERAGAEHVILNFGARPFLSYDAGAPRRAVS
jgi:alkanesulfonate monooxygenase SsuD/methylene tetrahydromethanopterin reductase-like flavin-dependent oxidoreductase (luciferase family)